MKSFFKNVLSTIVGVVLSVVVVVLLFIGIISIAISALDSDKETKVKANSILKITLSKPIVERASDNPFENLSITNMNPETEITHVVQEVMNFNDDLWDATSDMQPPLKQQWENWAKEIESRQEEARKAVMKWRENGAIS